MEAIEGKGLGIILPCHYFIQRFYLVRNGQNQLLLPVERLIKELNFAIK